ncbi:compound eye opsin BCRH2-like isoform X2 [Tigriopus californicus]|uniref:compound eye opsin BCRH2-like isoform X2 n=1 Tax=Tigriopus californicus TaxID=6832 RepID=UPI0027DA0F33|nr:compound eye opsin BCRH2-like isoform X2 [Tigriopus californicus]
MTETNDFLTNESNESMDNNKIYLDEFYRLYAPRDAYHGYDAPEDIRAHSSPHWYTFPPIHPFYQHAFGIFFFLLWVVCISGNGLVIYIFLKTKTLRTPSNMLIVALALSDFIMIWTQAPPLFVSMVISKYWAFGHFWCRMYAFTAGIFGCGSLWLIIFIGYDRYNVIVHGIGGVKITPMKALAMIVFAFTYSTCTITPTFLGVWGNIIYEGLLNACAFNYLSEDWKGKSYILFLVFFNLCLPLGFIIFFYSHIVKAVVNHERALKEQAKKMNVESLRSNVNADKESTEIRIAKVSLTAICLWLLAFAPYAITVLLAQFGPRHLITPLVAHVPSMLLKVAACFNPIIYAISHPKYREALATELPWLGIGEKSSECKKSGTVTHATTA